MAENFSVREREVVSRLAAAESVKEIAVGMGLTVNTVKDYLKAIYAKAQVHSARELLVRMYGLSPAPANPIARERLLHALDNLLTANDEQDVVQCLIESVHSCAGADRVGLWRAASTASDPIVISLAEADHRTAKPGQRLLRVFAEDATRVYTPTCDERHAIAALGLGLPMLAVPTLIPENANLGAGPGLPPGRTYLFASKPNAASFAPLEVSTCQILSRLAAVKCGGQPGAHKPLSQRLDSRPGA